MIKPKFVSVILLTYNWPQALDLILESLQKQTHKNFEIIIADDGSRDETMQLIKNWQNKSNIKIKHAWQKDNGFRASSARNHGTHLAKGDYLIYLDGDCVPQPDFIANHLILAEFGFFVTGNRAFLSKNFTESVLKNKTKIWEYSLKDWLRLYQMKVLIRIQPLIKIQLFSWMRKLSPYSIKSAKSCNLAIWKQDVLNVNGWDEDFHGWGLEDTDLILRLNFNGIKRKSGRFFVPVCHLWHTFESRKNETCNQRKINALLKKPYTQAKIGLKEQFPNCVHYSL